MFEAKDALKSIYRRNSREQMLGWLSTPDDISPCYLLIVATISISDANRILRERRVSKKRFRCGRDDGRLYPARRKFELLSVDSFQFPIASTSPPFPPLVAVVRNAFLFLRRLLFTQIDTGFLKLSVRSWLSVHGSLELCNLSRGFSFFDIRDELNFNVRALGWNWLRAVGKWIVAGPSFF